MEEKHHQDKEKLMSQLSVQTEQEQSAGWKGPYVAVQVQQQLRKRGKASCVTVNVQQQWDGGGEAPEVTIRVPQQTEKSEQTCVIVQLQHEWDRVEEVSTVSVRVQQQSIGSELSCPCVTVQVHQENQEAEVPSENVHLQNTDRYEEVPLVRKDQQDGHKEGLLTAEEEHQEQDQERTCVIRASQASLSDSEPLEQDTRDSAVKKCLLPQDRWDLSTEKQKRVQLLQTDQEESRTEEVMTENQLCDVRQTAEGTKTISLHPRTVSKDDLKEATTEQQNQVQKDSNVFDQPWASSDEGTSKAISEEQKVYGYKKQTAPKRCIRDAPNYFVAIPVTNDQILDKIEDVQELIFTKEPDLLRALIPVQAVHLTIIVAHLRTEDDVKRVPLPCQALVSYPLEKGSDLKPAVHLEKWADTCYTNPEIPVPLSWGFPGTVGVISPTSLGAPKPEILQKESQQMPSLLVPSFPVSNVLLLLCLGNSYVKSDPRKAIFALEKSKAKVEAMLQGKCFIMTFCGIGQFNNQVIYVKILDEDQQMLNKIAGEDDTDGSKETEEEGEAEPSEEDIAELGAVTPKSSYQLRKKKDKKK
ncbi:UNVERIFIED_CONTAM: hypothetical protein K2H54_051607 [Gekko kuhli]